MNGPPDEPAQPRPADDFVLAERVEADEEPEPVLAPPEGKSRAEIQAELDAERYSRLLRPLPREPAPARLTFSLADLFLATTCCALGLAGASWIRPDIYAGVLGVVSLIVIPLFYALGAEPLVLRRLWIITLTAYLTACLAALVRVFLHHPPT